MPFQSEKQKKWMWANKPEMAREWTQEYGSKVKAKRGIMATKKDDKWIQKATKNMRKDKPCTGDKFGGPTCPKGSRRYNLAKTFKKMNKAATGTMVKAQNGTYVNANGDYYPRRYTAKKASGHPVIQGNIKRTKIGNKRMDPKFIRKVYELANKNKAEDKLTKWDIEQAEKKLLNKAGGGPVKAVLGLYAMSKMSDKKKDKVKSHFKKRASLLSPVASQFFNKGGPIKAQDSKFITKKKWWQNPKKLKSLTENLKADLQFIKEAQAGKLSPSLMEKAKTKVLKKSSADQGSGYADEIRKIIKQKPSIVGDEAKGGQGFTPGWKPHLSVRTAKEGKVIKAKKGVFSGAASSMYDKPPGWEASKISKKTHKKLTKLWKHRETGGWKEAKGYKKHLKALGKMQKAPLSGISKTLPPKTARLLGQLKFAYKDRSKARALLPAAKALGKRTGIGKILLGAGAVGAAYEAGKRNLFKLKDKKKVQKKSIGGEIIIGRGVDLDLL